MESQTTFGFNPAATVVGDYSKVAEAQGEVADVQAKFKAQSEPFDFLGVAKVATETIGVLNEEQNMIDAHKTKVEAIEFMASNQHLSGADLSTTIKSKIEEISSGDYSIGYKEGYLSILDYGYTQALTRKEEERIVGSLNVVSSGFSTLIDSSRRNNVEIPNIEEYAAKASSKFRLPIEQVRNAMLSSFYTDSAVLINAANSPTELQAVLADIKEKEGAYKSPRFLDSRSKKFLPIITKQKADQDTLIKSKIAQFKQQSYQRISDSIDSGYTLRPDEIEADIKATSSNPVAAQTALNKYTKDYTEHTEAVSYLAENPIGNNPGFYPNDTAKKQRQQLVTNTLTDTWLTGNSSEFVRIAFNEKGLTKDAGTMFIAQLGLAKPKEKEQLMVMFDKVLETPKGATVLRQMLTDDEYTKLVKTRYVQRFRPEYTVEQARNYIEGASKNVAKVDFLTTDKIRMSEYAVELGKQGPKFQATMDALIATDVAMAKDMMKDVAGFYLKQVGKSTTGTKVDNSMGTVPDSLEPERTDKIIDTALNNPSSIAYVQDYIIGYDDIGGTVKIVNSKGLVDKSNKDVEYEARHGLKEKSLGDFIESASRATLDNSGLFLTGAVDVLTETGANIGSALWGNISRNFKEDVANSPEFVQNFVTFVDKFTDIEMDNPAQVKEVVKRELEDNFMETLKQQSTLLDTSTEIEVENNTMTPNMQDSLKNSLELNKLNKEAIDGFLESLKEKTQATAPTTEEVTLAQQMLETDLSGATPETDMVPGKRTAGPTVAGAMPRPKEKSLIDSITDGFSAMIDDLTEYISSLFSNDTKEINTPTALEAISIKAEGGKPGKDGLYRPYPSIEGGTDTVGHGHKLTKAEIKSGEIFGIPYKKGLSEKEVLIIYRKDKERLTKNLGLEGKSEEIKFLAADVAHRAGNISKWTFLKELKKGNLGKAYIQTADMYWTDTKGNKRFYNNRNLEIFKAVGYTPTAAEQKAYDDKQK